MDCIILAGGLGTRLAPVVTDRPKCMADVNGRPFLDYILEEIEQQGVVDHVILSLGYKHEMVINWLKEKAFLFKISWVIERELKGTGGAIKFAMQKAKSEEIIVINGDTFFNIDWNDFIHSKPENSELFLALREVENANRYGNVITDEEGKIIQFTEKSDEQTPGKINAGIYLMKKSIFDGSEPDEAFSFEKEIMPKICNQGKMYGKLYQEYFIDIGMPEDYQQFIEDKK